MSVWQPYQPVNAFQLREIFPQHRDDVCVLGWPPCSHVQLPSTEEIEAMFMDRRLNTIVFFLDETFEELSYDVTGGGAFCWQSRFA